MSAINQTNNNMKAELIGSARLGLATGGNTNVRPVEAVPSLLAGQGALDTFSLTDALLSGAGQATSAAPRKAADQAEAKAQKPAGQPKATAASQDEAGSVSGLLDRALKLNASGGGMLSGLLGGTSASATGTAKANTAVGAANGLNAEDRTAKMEKIEKLKNEIAASSDGKRAKRRQKNWGNEIASLEKELGLPSSDTTKAAIQKEMKGAEGTATSAGKTANPETKKAISQLMQGGGGGAGRNLTAFTGQNFLPSFNAATILRNTMGGEQAAGQAADGKADGKAQEGATNAFNLGGMGGINLGAQQQPQQAFNPRQWGTGVDPTLMRALEFGNAQPSPTMQRALALAGFNPNGLNPAIQQILNAPIALPTQGQTAQQQQAAAAKK